MEKEIVEILKSERLSEIGFAKIDYFKDIEKCFVFQEKNNYKTLFQSGDISSKTFKNEKLFKTAIVVLMPYYKVSDIKNKNFAYVSSSFCGIDYHIILKEKLKNTASFLESLGYVAKIFVDNNGLDERYLAYKAGLGFYGLNHLLINDKYGSFFYIGVILTDAILKYSSPLNRTCFMCKKCLTACPNIAIKESGEFDGNKCVSYITQKKDLLIDEEEFIGQCIFGCDICMNVCPHNDNIKHYDCSEVLKIDVNSFQHLSNKEFIRLYGKYSFSWRSRNVFERNLNIYKQKLEKNDKL